MTFDEVVSVALVGTARSQLTFADGDDPLAGALAIARQGTAEDQLLAAAAMLSAYEGCGSAPAASPTDAGDAAPDDEWPACSRRAGGLLAQLLGMPNNPTKLHLMNEWIAAAADAKRRVPHALLPAVLEYGAANRSARNAMASVVDQRGRWLMSLHKRWQFAASEDEDAANLWTTGNCEQRTSALRRLRKNEPARARELVQSTWNEDGAGERSGFVEAMRTGLSIEDEPFLEATLDDRSKQVRATAADLLSRLKGSALVGRMVSRVDPLLTFCWKADGGLLRKNKQASIEIALPPEVFDPVWSRDGITEKPQLRMGQRQWWLQQMLAVVPPSHWSTMWRMSAVECVAAATGDFAELMRDAWAVAAERHDDADWMLALFQASLHGRGGGPRFSLAGRLPIDRQRTALAQLFSLPDVDPSSLVTVVESAPALDESVALLAIDQVERHALKSAGNYDYRAAALLGELAIKVPPHLHDALAVRLVRPAWEGNATLASLFLQTLQLRRDIQAEFAT